MVLSILPTYLAYPSLLARPLAFLAPKTPLPFPFKSLPRRLGKSGSESSPAVAWGGGKNGEAGRHAFDATVP